MCACLTTVIGGASSGKSSFAEKLCLISGLERVYLASSQVLDDEMRTKVERHRTDRGADWCTIEEPLDAARVFRGAKSGQIVLFDCATMWLTNHLLAEHDLDKEVDNLLDALSTCAAQVVVVTNETGMGIVPENAMARAFRIAQGGLNRRLAAQSDHVLAVMAGLPFALKGSLPGNDELEGCTS